MQRMSDVILPLKPKFGNEGHIRADKARQAEMRLKITQEAALELQWLITQWEKDYNEHNNKDR